MLGLILCFAYNAEYVLSSKHMSIVLTNISPTSNPIMNALLSPAHFPFLFSVDAARRLHSKSLNDFVFTLVPSLFGLNSVFRTQFTLSGVLIFRSRNPLPGHAIITFSPNLNSIESPLSGSSNSYSWLPRTFFKTNGCLLEKSSLVRKLQPARTHLSTTSMYSLLRCVYRPFSRTNSPVSARTVAKSIGINTAPVTPIVVVSVHGFYVCSYSATNTIEGQNTFLD